MLKIIYSTDLFVTLSFSASSIQNVASSYKNVTFNANPVSNVPRIKTRLRSLSTFSCFNACEKNANFEGLSCNDFTKITKFKAKL